MALRRHLLIALATLLTPELRIHLARGEMWLFKGHDALKAREECAIAAQEGLPQGAYCMAQTYDPAVLLLVHADLAQADQGMAKAWYREAMKPR